MTDCNRPAQVARDDERRDLHNHGINDHDIADAILDDLLTGGLAYTETLSGQIWTDNPRDVITRILEIHLERLGQDFDQWYRRAAETTLLGEAQRQRADSSLATLRAVRHPLVEWVRNGGADS